MYDLLQIAAWHRWKSVNVAFDLEKLHREKSKKRYLILYGAITNHFGNGNSYKKDMHDNKNLWRTYYFLLPKPTCLLLL